MNWGHILFSFSGRINRAKWWLSVLAMIIIYAALVAVPPAVSNQGALVGVLALIGAVVYLWIYLAAGAKRLHDLNRSGAWLVVFIVAPIIVTIVFFVMAWGAIGPAIMSGQTPGETELTQIISQMIGLVAVFGLISLGFFLWWLIWFGCLRGTVGANQYGPDPLEGKI
jgi:uncharacterized membrane protein YhaH (DUF805 family)